MIHPNGEALCFKGLRRFAEARDTKPNLDDGDVCLNCDGGLRLNGQVLRK